MQQWRAVLLDIDGTLVDSNDAHAKAFQEVFERHGHHIPFASIRRCIGMGGDKLIPRLLGKDTPSEKRDAIGKEKTALFQAEYLPKLRPFPRTKELLGKLKHAGFLLGVASSADEKELNGLLGLLGIERLLDAVTSADDADRSKPDPDILEAALSKLGADARDTVLVGDTPYDMEAALRCGMAFIGVRCGGWDDRSLGRAIALYDDPQDLFHNLELSPFAYRYEKTG
jgi:HAD superfamily hydrolase (TIGR01509 family)